MSDYPQLNIAVIGAGFHATTTVLPSLIHLPFNIEAIVDVDEKKAEAVAARYGARAYDSTASCYAQEKALDAVLLIVGAKHHPRLIAEAIAAGLHVWAEKPAARSAREIDELLPAVEASGKIAMIGYKKAFMPAVDKIIEIINREDSGSLTHVLGQYPIGMGGSWHANSSHPLACMLACAGPVKRLRKHIDASGGGTLSLEFMDGHIGTLIMANKSRGTSECYQFFCEQTHVELEDGNYLQWHRGQRPGDQHRWLGEGDDHGSITWQVQNCYAKLDNRLEMTQGFHHELLSFHQHIIDKTQPRRGSLLFARALTELEELVAQEQHDDWIACTSVDWRVKTASLQTV